MAAILACGFLGSAVLLHSAIPALARWEAPYGVEGRESPAESATIDGILANQVGEYDLVEVVPPAPPIGLHLLDSSMQGNYGDGARVVHLLVADVESLEEAHSLVAQVDQEVKVAGAKGLEWSFECCRWPGGAWKVSRLAWGKWYVRFHVPEWGDQAYGVAWNNGPWFFMATSDSLSTMRDLVAEFDY